MRASGSLFRFVLLLAAVTCASAQSVTISPLSPSLAVGKTIQFSAQVTGLTRTGVTWSAGGAVGGNSTAGTITAKGLYKAPASLPGQNPVQITATSVANPKLAASTYVYILSAGPNITSVSPNPLQVGAITVTIAGTRFQAGAVVFDTYGTNSGIALVTTSVTAAKVTATGYQGSAASATFCVKNPGSVCSNSLTVPVTGGSPPPGTYSLTVVNGAGSGNYSAGTVVTISANPPPTGQSFAGWTGAAVQNPNSATTTLTMPSANTTVTANYSSSTTYSLTVVNGSGSGNYPAGTVVTISANSPPAGQVFQNWTGATVQDPHASPTTLTMPAANATVTANYSAPPPVPYPVSSHPRLWITPADLPRLQSWATSANPVYQQGMLPVLNQAINIYNTQFFPGGLPNPNYPDPGDTQGYTGYLTEQYGAIFAFNSLIDPDPAARIRYAQYARNLIMYAMNTAAQGHLPGAPFRDPMFAVYNRANGQGEQWPLIVDWIYNATDASGNAILTAGDKLTIRNVFMIWANDCLNAYTTGGDHPSPIGVTNSLQLLPNNQPYRMASNNYYIGHARLLTMMALSIDPGDDPALNNGAPTSQLGNSLRSYILNANGAWLYQQFAMMGEPATVAAAYGIGGSGAGFGLASGGLPPEGMLYGESFGFLLGQLLALQTAGFNNVNYSGPQIQLIGAPVWDRYVTAILTAITPTAQTPPTEPWLGPIYEYGSYGDVLRIWVTPDYMKSFALLCLLEQQNGVTAHLSAARWFAVTAEQGGASALYSRITNPWSFTESILYFLLLDPASPAATDPRPTYPTIFYDPAAGRIIAHSDWSATNTMFDYRASWESINHQDGDGGQFELYRKGEWLTKEMSNYDNNGLGMTTVYHNTLALQNTCPNGTPSNLQWYEAGEWANGSQFILAENAGDPTTVMSTGPGYVYAASDLTNLYNRPNAWTPADSAVNITQATRSIVWFNNDYVVVYDRATSLNAGLFKRFNLSLINNPVINGKVAVETNPSGQRLFIQTLLPQNSSASSFYGAGNMNPIAELEPTQYIFTVQDPSNPVDTRFLHVLQGADAGAPMTQASYLQSASGTAFDGAVFGSAVIFFPVSRTVALAGATLPAPAGVHTMLVTGLAPNTGYGVAVQPNGNSNTVTISTTGSAATSDGAGLLRLTF
ncbi:MAG: hypothetical protein U0Q18_01250 [Bryobacteraceae bacterium]